MEESMADEKQESPEDEQNEDKSKFRNVADDVADYVGKNQVDSAAYVLLLVGFFVSFANPMIGGLIVGVVVGLYYARECLAVIAKLNDLIDDYGPVKSLVAVTALVFVGIHAFWFLLGFAGTVAVKALMESRSSA